MQWRLFFKEFLLSYETEHNLRTFEMVFFSRVRPSTWPARWSQTRERRNATGPSYFVFNFRKCQHLRSTGDLIFSSWLVLVSIKLSKAKICETVPCGLCNFFWEETNAGTHKKKIEINFEPFHFYVHVALSFLHLRKDTEGGFILRFAFLNNDQISWLTCCAFEESFSTLQQPPWKIYVPPRAACLLANKKG